MSEYQDFVGNESKIIMMIPCLTLSGTQQLFCGVQKSLQTFGSKNHNRVG